MSHAQQLQAYIAAEDPDNGQVVVRALGFSTPYKAMAFTDHLNENPVNDWSGDTPALVMVARHPGQVLDFLNLNFQAPRRRGARFVNIAGPELPAPAPH